MTRARPRWERWLDRGPHWGSLDISARGYGVIRYRLMVFPPGISSDERVALRLWRAFPVWGAVYWLVAQGVLVGAIGPALAFAFSTGTCAAAGVVTMMRAGPARSQVRTLHVVRMVGINDAMVKPHLDEMRSLAEILVRADTRLDAGHLNTVEHEAEVWQVYDRMAPTASVG